MCWCLPCARLSQRGPGLGTHLPQPSLSRAGRSHQHTWLPSAHRFKRTSAGLRESTKPSPETLCYVSSLTHGSHQQVHQGSVLTAPSHPELRDPAWGRGVGLIGNALLWVLQNGTFLSVENSTSLIFLIFLNSGRYFRYETFSPDWKSLLPQMWREALSLPADGWQSRKEALGCLNSTPELCSSRHAASAGLLLGETCISHIAANLGKGWGNHPPYSKQVLLLAFCCCLLVVWVFFYSF